MMSSRRYLHAFVLAAMIVLAPRHARAISFTLAGPEPEGVPSTTDLTSTIWGSLPGGALVNVATVGADAPGGGKFTEMGVPSISPESQVIFGAEVTGTDGVAQWEIFRRDLTAPPGRRLVRAIESAAASPGCVPNIKLDPYPIAGSNGAIAFIAPEANGSDALFRYANGELTCAVRIGDRTAEGHTLRMMHFGSATMAPSGEVAFLGRIDNGDSRDPALIAARVSRRSSPRRMDRFARSRWRGRANQMAHAISPASVCQQWSRLDAARWLPLRLSTLEDRTRAVTHCMSLAMARPSRCWRVAIVLPLARSLSFPVAGLRYLPAAQSQCVARPPTDVRSSRFATDTRW